jgi:hypothetical protein
MRTTRRRPNVGTGFADPWWFNETSRPSSMCIGAISFLLFFSMVGCANPNVPRSRVFPGPDATSYLAPDGRTWLLHELVKPKEGMYQGGYCIEFTPTKVAKHGETEILTFGYWKENFAADELRKRFELLINRDGADLKYTVDGTSDDSFYSLAASLQKERSMQRSVRRGSAYCFVTYSHYRETEGLKPLSFWEKVLRNWPSISLEPPPGAVR